jgi:TolB-like protein
MRKTTYILFFSAFLLLLSFSISDAYEKEIKALSASLAENIVTSGKKSVAVVDFADLQGNVTELGRFLSEEFSVALSESGKRFEVVDRAHLNSILKEQKLSLSGLVDPKTVQKIGALAGVECLVTGTLTPFGDSIRIAVKALDTSTARVIGGSRGDIARTKAIEELLGTLVQPEPQGDGVGNRHKTPPSEKQPAPQPVKLTTQRPKIPISSASTDVETGRDGRFIAYNNGTVLDTRTNLMWAAKDNNSKIAWANAKSYCENYRGGGYTDWRMPTQEELAWLYDAGKSRPGACNSYPIHVATELIDITCIASWASETRGSEAAHFDFDYGDRHWTPLSFDTTLYRALPVRSGR